MIEFVPRTVYVHLVLPDVKPGDDGCEQQAQDETGGPARVADSCHP